MKITDFKAGMTVYDTDNKELTVEVIYAAKNCKPKIFARYKTGFAKWFSPDKLSKTSPAKWINLGLPSGTIWKSDIERNKKGEPIYLNFEDAKVAFKNKLPKLWQFTELIYECKWEWKGDGYELTGPNGNSIFLPAAGYLDLNMKVSKYPVDVFVLGCYWSSIQDNIHNSHYFRFSSEYILPYYTTSRTNELTIILCKK